MKISRQQKLKLKYLIGGRCVNCGKKKYLLSKCSCEDCLDKDRDRMRIKTKVKKYLGRKWVRV